MQSAKTRLALLLLLLTACAGPAGNRDGSTGGASNRLTQAELVDAQVESVFDAIRRLRPGWLRQRVVNSLQGGNNAGSTIARGGSAPTNEVVVYLDNVRVGGPEVLRAILANDTEGIEYLDATSATSRFGTGNVAGAILVTTR